MELKTEEAIKKLTDKAIEARDSNDALKFTQSALNLAHVEATLSNIPDKSAS